MTCYLRQVSSSESVEIDTSPDRAYELILGESILEATEQDPLARSEKAMEQVNALHDQHASTLERVHQANLKREPISTELRAEYDQWLAEYQTLTASWSTRKGNPKAGIRSASRERTPELRIDKSWHGLHFLLTGRAEGGDPPLSLALLGGKSVPDRRGLMGFGPALKLSPDEVREVSQSLAAIKPSDLLKNYDAEAMRNNEVYAMGIDGQEDREYLSHFYKKLRAFYADASKRQNGLLIYLK